MSLRDQAQSLVAAVAGFKLSSSERSVGLSSAKSPSSSSSSWRPARRRAKSSYTPPAPAKASSAAPAPKPTATASSPAAAALGRWLPARQPRLPRQRPQWLPPRRTPTIGNLLSI